MQLKSSPFFCESGHPKQVTITGGRSESTQDPLFTRLNRKRLDLISVSLKCISYDEEHGKGIIAIVYLKAVQVLRWTVLVPVRFFSVGNARLKGWSLLRQLTTRMGKDLNNEISTKTKMNETGLQPNSQRTLGRHAKYMEQWTPWPHR